MASSIQYTDICLWKKDRLQQFLRERGIPVSGRIDQLRAIVYGALYFNIPLKPSAAEVEKKRRADYQQLLTVKGHAQTCQQGGLARLLVYTYSLLVCMEI